MATTVKTARKYDRLTPGLEYFARTMEGRPIPKKLENELLRLKRIEDEEKARKKAKAKRRKKHASWW
jgi:hypothetical protein